MHSSDQTFEDIMMSLDLLEQCFASICQEVDIWVEGLPCPAMEHKMDILTDDHGASNSKTNLRFHWLPTKRHVPDGSSFPITLFFAIPSPLIEVKGVPPISSTSYDAKHGVRRQWRKHRKPLWNIPKFSPPQRSFLLYIFWDTLGLRKGVSVSIPIRVIRNKASRILFIIRNMTVIFSLPLRSPLLHTGQVLLSFTKLLLLRTVVQIRLN